MKIKKKDFFGKSDPYFVISKTQENGTILKVYESNIIKNTLNPVWSDVRIRESTLNNGDDERMILWEGINIDSLIRTSDHTGFKVFLIILL